MKLDPQHTALIAVHLQNDIMGASGAFAPFFRSQIEERGVLDSCARLTTAARDAGALVVFTRVAWKPDHSDLVDNSPLLQMVRQNGCLKDGEPGADLIPEAGVTESDLVHTHTRIGGFDDALASTFRSRSITDVLLCGVATNASVEGTARQLSDAGYAVHVVDEACSAATPEAHTASLESLGLVAGVCSLEDALSALSGGDAA